jgi:hypothetical protein
MKKTKILIAVVLTLIGVSSSFSSSAQEWGEVGTKWVYQTISQGAPRLHKYEVTKDTLIGNFNAKKIEVTQINFTGISSFTVLNEFHYGNLFFYAQGDSIYWYNNFTFEFLYDLSPSIGDLWETKENQAFSCINTLETLDTQRVISVEPRDVDGKIIDVYGIDVGQDWFFGFEVYKGIGPSMSLFPIPSSNCQGIDILAFQVTPSNLLCYSNDVNESIIFNTISSISGFVSCGEYVVSVEDFSRDESLYPQESTINIFPNPAKNKLYIKNDKEDMQFKVHIFDITGKSVGEFLEPTNEIDLQTLNLLNGIYFLQIWNASSTFILTKKIIINNE